MRCMDEHSRGILWLSIFVLHIALILTPKVAYKIEKDKNAPSWLQSSTIIQIINKKPIKYSERSHFALISCHSWIALQIWNHVIFVTEGEPKQLHILAERRRRCSVQSSKEDILNFLKDVKRTGLSHFDSDSPSVQSLDSYYDDDTTSEVRLVNINFCVCRFWNI